MSLADVTTAEVALDAIRSQRLAAAGILEELELLAAYEPTLVCLVEWAGPTFDAYQRDLEPVISRLIGARNAVRDAVDDLWAAIGEAGND